MAKKEPSSTSSGKEDDARSLLIAKRGIRTAPEFANLMSALMTDLITGAITPMTANATCNCAGKLLKVTELQHKYGAAKAPLPADKVLKLATGE